MQHRTESPITPESPAPHGSRARSARRRRVWVRVETDVETYVGCLASSGGRTGLDDVLNDGRAYLALWDATVAGKTTAAEEYVALHKGTIRSVVVLPPAEIGSPSGSGR